MKQEILITVEQDVLNVTTEQDTLGYDFSNKVEVVNTFITNEDGTLSLIVNGKTTNINTNVIQRYNSHYEFPNRGKENVLYIDIEDSEIYYWKEGKYIKLNDYDKIKIIYGGEA